MRDLQREILILSLQDCPFGWTKDPSKTKDTYGARHIIEILYNLKDPHPIMCSKWEWALNSSCLSHAVYSTSGSSLSELFRIDNPITEAEIVHTIKEGREYFGTGVLEKTRLEC